MRVYRRNVVGIETMVLNKLAARGSRSTEEVLISEDDVRGRIAQEALPTLSDVLRAEARGEEAHVQQHTGRVDQAG